MLGLSVPAHAQTCNYVPKPSPTTRCASSPTGRETQYYCAPCHDRRAVKTVVAEAEVRQLDTYNHQVLINGQPTDLAYLYLFDPRPETLAKPRPRPPLPRGGRRAPDAPREPRRAVRPRRKPLPAGEWVGWVSA